MSIDTSFVASSRSVFVRRRRRFTSMLGESTIQFAMPRLRSHRCSQKPSRPLRSKAQALAKSRGLVIETEVADLGDYRPKERHFGSVISISAHLPSSIRKKLYPLIEKALQPNGIVLLEGEGLTGMASVVQFIARNEA